MPEVRGTCDNVVVKLILLQSHLNDDLLNHQTQTVQGRDLNGSRKAA